MDFVKDAERYRQADLERVKNKISKICPRYVQDVSVKGLENLAVCLLRCMSEISAQEMLEGLEEISYKQKRRKYLDLLLAMGAIEMTLPDKPTSKKQRYVISELGLELIKR